MRKDGFGAHLSEIFVTNQETLNLRPARYENKKNLHKLSGTDLSNLQQNQQIPFRYTFSRPKNSTKQENVTVKNGVFFM